MHNLHILEVKVKRSKNNMIFNIVLNKKRNNMLE
jgi:hypothetical protein